MDVYDHAHLRTLGVSHSDGYDVSYDVIFVIFNEIIYEMGHNFLSSHRRKSKPGMDVHHHMPF